MIDKIDSFIQERRAEKPKRKKVYQSFVPLGDGKLAEEITNPDPRFIVYSPESGLIELRDTVKIGEEYIYPVDGDLVTKKVILFPEKAEEFDDVESLRKDLQTFIHKYVDIHPFYEKLASYYVLLTWLFDRNTTVTYLGVFGDYGSGKTRAAQIIGRLCYKPAFVSGALTCAPIYRILEVARGTLVINEFDFDKSDMGIELIKILNNGYEKNMHVLRVEPKTGKVEAFDAFGPKIFTYRTKKKDQAFESRLITITMEETKRDDIPITLPLNWELEARELSNKLLMFRFKNYAVQPLVDTSIFKGTERRLRQTFYPLLTVINDHEFVSEVDNFIHEYQDQQIVDRGLTWLADYLSSLVELTCETSEITVKALADKLNEGKDIKDQLSARKVGSAVRNELKLKTSRLSSGQNKGQFGIKIDAEKIRNHCLKYGIEIPEQSSLYSLTSPQDRTQSEDSEVGEVLVEAEPILDQAELKYIKEANGQ